LAFGCIVLGVSVAFLIGQLFVPRKPNPDSPSSEPSNQDPSPAFGTTAADSLRERRAWGLIFAEASIVIMLAFEHGLEHIADPIFERLWILRGGHPSLAQSFALDQNGYLSKAPMWFAPFYIAAALLPLAAIAESKQGRWRFVMFLLVAGLVTQLVLFWVHTRNI
jgi:hypothetical protein